MLRTNVAEKPRQCWGLEFPVRENCKSHTLEWRGSLFAEYIVRDRIAVSLQYVLPKIALTAFGGKIAGAKAGNLTTRLIHWFVGRYGVNMSEAANANIASYASFNEFFTQIGRAHV